MGRGNAVAYLVLVGTGTLLLRATLGQQDPAGAESCRCINPWTPPPPGDTRTCRQLSVNRQLDWGKDNTTLTCVPLTYGTFCGSHDNATHHPACLTPAGQPVDSGAPEWCAARWCYVNASACTRPHRLTDAPVLASDTHADLYHSYETCGNLNACECHRFVMMRLRACILCNRIA